MHKTSTRAGGFGKHSLLPVWWFSRSKVNNFFHSRVSKTSENLGVREIAIGWKWLKKMQFTYFFPFNFDLCEWRLKKRNAHMYCSCHSLLISTTLFSIPTWFVQWQIQIPSSSIVGVKMWRVYCKLVDLRAHVPRPRYLWLLLYHLRMRARQRSRAPASGSVFNFLWKQWREYVEVSDSSSVIMSLILLLFFIKYLYYKEKLDADHS